MKELDQWEKLFADWLRSKSAEYDGAHDMIHIQRVVAVAKTLAQAERADLAVVIPAAWLHDCVTLPKTSERRHLASRLAAEAAGAFLQEHGYPAEHIPAIEHAIVAHSFSAQIPPETIEAKVVQDADRLDAIGAVGLARCIVLGGEFGSQLYHPDDPLAAARELDDKAYMLDHFYTKLFKLAGMMQTAAGRAEGTRRNQFLQSFVDQLLSEIQ